MCLLHPMKFKWKYHNVFTEYCRFYLADFRSGGSVPDHLLPGLQRSHGSSLRNIRLQWTKMACTNDSGHTLNGPNSKEHSAEHIGPYGSVETPSVTSHPASASEGDRDEILGFVDTVISEDPDPEYSTMQSPCVVPCPANKFSTAVRNSSEDGGGMKVVQTLDGEDLQQQQQQQNSQCKTPRTKSAPSRTSRRTKHKQVLQIQGRL